MKIERDILLEEKKGNEFPLKRYIYIKVAYILLILAFFFFFIRYKNVFKSIPYIFSIDDMLWEIGIIYFLKFIFYNKRKIFIIFSFLFFIIMLCEELIQKITLNNGIFITTYSKSDLVFYIIGYIISMFSIYIIQRKKYIKYENKY